MSEVTRGRWTIRWREGIGERPIAAPGTLSTAITGDVEVMPVAEHQEFVNELLASREQAELTVSRLHGALEFMRSCELSGEAGADHPTVLRALETTHALGGNA